MACFVYTLHHDNSTYIISEFWHLPVQMFTPGQSGNSRKFPKFLIKNVKMIHNATDEETVKPQLVRGPHQTLSSSGLPLWSSTRNTEVNHKYVYLTTM